MCLSNKEMDRALEIVEAENEYVLQHAADNSPDYVAHRYMELCGSYGYPVPIRAGAIDSAVGRLFPASRTPRRKGICDVRSIGQKNGIIATLRDEASGELGDYRVETNGLNGVEVTGRV